jgi:hypothetical protein
MRKLVSRRPSPSLVISIVALVVALTGTAIAGVATISKLSKSEKRKVRGLADQEIDKKAPALSVKSAGTAGDVTNQMWAVVNADGTTFRKTAGITTTSEESAGRYIVSADRDVSGCFYVATLGGNSPDAGFRGDISVDPIAGASNTVYVLTSNTNSPPTNEERPFTLLIRC